MPVEANAVENLYRRITTFLEELPPHSRLLDVRRGLSRLADAARARNDLAQLQKLHREAQLLAESVLRSGARESVGNPRSPNPPSAARVEAGPGLLDWDRTRRPAIASSWRRPQAPIRYPFGHPPTGWDTRMHETTVSMPDSKLSAAALARLNARRRSLASAREAEKDALELYGRVSRQGVDYRPEWYWPDDPA